MADSGTKTYSAAKRYIYAWGGGKAEGNGGMKDLLGGKGAGLRGSSTSMPLWLTALLFVAPGLVLLLFLGPRRRALRRRG